ncbi:hypothetical protein FGIG_12384 [Fasciola gigantica]|uniref:Uncharacterized protein n=1 Tax=Fasciola gigantica TaxID=46835 RepID=A0A504WV24_FASGI|nr:hypothetical protein FGIG_12384 [Fasciola gigantica]
MSSVQLVRKQPGLLRAFCHSINTFWMSYKTFRIKLKKMKPVLNISWVLQKWNICSQMSPHLQPPGRVS